MSTRGQGHRRAARTAAVALAVALVGPLAAGPAAATADPVRAAAVAQRAVPTAEDYSPGLRAAEAVTYTVDLAASVVHVEHVITLTNEQPDEVTSTYIREFYFPDYSVPVLAGATGLTARRDGHGRLGVQTRPVEGGMASIVVIDLAPDLQYGQTHTVRLTYDLPGQPPRSGAVAQVNQAFATFPVFSSADPGLGSVTVVLPGAPVTTEVVGSALTRSTSDGSVVYTATGIADPAEWFATIIARDDAALVERTVDYGPDGVRIQGWPGDTEWLDFTADLAERGLPALETAIGVPWGAHGQLDIVETAAPYVYGYGGWYQHNQSLIEVGDVLDAHVTLHEMAHAWFNAERFDGRWISEAFADEFAAVAMAEIGLERPLPTAPVDGAPGALPLNAWMTPALDAPESEDQEAYGYATSWWMAHTLGEQTGPEGLAAVIRAAVEGQTAYDAESDPVGHDGATDWRALLDLMELVGGATDAPDLFAAYVVTELEAPLLAERAAALEDYQELVEAADGWAPPALVREPMAAWDFAAAVSAIPDVRDLFERRDAVARILGTVDEELTDAVRRDFERGGEIGALRRDMGDLEAAADALVDATQSVEEANPFARIGLLVVDAEAELSGARAALREADYDTAVESADAATEQVGTAALLGGVGVGGLLLLLVVVALVVRSVRRRRRFVPPPAFALADGPPAPPLYAPGPATPPLYVPGPPGPPAQAPYQPPAPPNQPPPPPPPPA